jgi:CHAD domain-containing protein
MKAAFTEKWIEGVAPENRTSNVALRTLQSRLGAVLHYLPLAAEKALEDSAYVHQLRVATRRAAAALSLYADLMPRHRFWWIKKQLKRVRRAANDARDCDMLIQRLKRKQSSRETKRWLKAVRAERAEAQKAIVAVKDRLWREQRLARRIDKLLERVQSRDKEKAGAASGRFGDWAREHLRPLVEQFFGAIPSDRTDEAALHQLRIRGKELRYAIEFLASAFPDKLRTGLSPTIEAMQNRLGAINDLLYPTIKAMQDRLGEINDLATVKARLGQQLEAASAADVASWRRLLANEQAQLDQARQKFWDWCTPQMLQALRDGFEAMLGGPTRASESHDRPLPVTASDPSQAPGPGTDALPGVGEGFPGSGTMRKAQLVSEPGEQELLLPAWSIGHRQPTTEPRIG